VETFTEFAARQFTPAEQAAIDADIAKLDALMAQRRERVLAELDKLEASTRSELRAIVTTRNAIVLGRALVIA
jgi:hypothetical protein